MVKEGYGYGVPLLILAGVLLGFRIVIPGVLFLLAAVFVFNFFRDPERRIPDEPDVIVSPADGRVVEIVEEEVEGCLMRRLSIFMSPWDVHVNRAPIRGLVKRVSYKPGAFHMAYRSKASVENEQNTFILEGSQGTVQVKQIAGALARRIVFWKRPGQTVGRGERVGLIKFGSRVDVMVESSAEWRVKVGDYVRAGSTVLGVIKAKS